ncbi:hypothetical protein ASE63_05390 [Bosea sp. Root381]|uniref:hypothetical protein n=1 Tax=Bosea sp. Root381 TaxID=1736524 RepID=UPI0006F42D88|nr:hypothetical protein [Bosea sp. Root381]KRE09936.1 hypothetical protein ASE63_05390 [Bosea sp. Root381]
MPENDFAADNAAFPNDAEMRLYARAFEASMTADELFLRWESYLAHAMLLDQSPDCFHADYGLNGRQLAEGARIAARRMALLLAEAPTQLRAVLALKVHTFEAMAPLDGEGNRSNAIFMVEAAMKADAERLDIVLLPLDRPIGPTQ